MNNTFNFGSFMLGLVTGSLFLGGFTIKKTTIIKKEGEE